MQKDKISEEDVSIAETLINLSERERINLRKMVKKESLEMSFDIINWRKNKYKEPLKNFKMPKKSINFLIDKNRSIVIHSFNKRFESNLDKDYYYAAQDFIIPRESLLCELEYN